MTFGYTTNPGYVDLVYDVYRTMQWHYREDNWANYTNFIDEFQRFYHFKLEDTIPIVYIAIAFTLVRYFFELVICKHFVKGLNIDSKADAGKLPESLWKTIAYLGLWSYCSYVLVFSGKYDYFTNPFSIWDDWSLDMSVPEDITWLYFIECGFYLHSVYATLYMDAVRKDFMAMLFHHVLTITLIVVSYACRYHKIGILVVFVHDVTDIFLEFVKSNIYLRNRNKSFYKLNDRLATAAFIAFTISWYLFRLYWFPLKILYSTGVVALHRAVERGVGLYTFFNGLLWALLILDLYWFYFVVILLVKIATGQAREVNDDREYEEESAKKTE